MMTPGESARDWQRQMLAQQSSLLSNIGLRLASWLVLGNTGALVLAFQAMLDGKLCSERLAHAIIWYFAAGVFAAFLGTACNYFSGLYGMRYITRSMALVDKLATNEWYIAKLKSDGVEVNDESPLQKEIDELVPKQALLLRQQWRVWPLFVASIALYFLSAVYFANGVLVPASNAAQFGPSCVNIK